MATAKKAEPADTVVLDGNTDARKEIGYADLEERVNTLTAENAKLTNAVNKLLTMLGNKYVQELANEVMS